MWSEFGDNSGSKVTVSIDNGGIKGERRRYLVVAEEMLRGIALGNLCVGDRLPDERTLANQFSASRATVREAILALELAGVIETRRGSGHYLKMVGFARSVQPMSTLDGSPREILEVRRLLEPAAAVLACRHIQPNEVVHLEGLLDEAEALSDESQDKNLDRFVELSLAFHRDLARACGNTVLADIVSGLVDAVAHPLWLLVDRIVARSAKTRHEEVAEHRRILAAVASQRSSDAEESMAEHLGALSNRMLANRGFRRQPFKRLRLC
jgi:DNA-binding FadR family transcriptional regulator